MGKVFSAPLQEKENGEIEALVISREAIGPFMQELFDKLKIGEAITLKLIDIDDSKLKEVENLLKNMDDVVH